MNMTKIFFKNKALILPLMSIAFLMIVNTSIRKHIDNLSKKYIYLNETSLENTNKNFISKEFKNRERGFDHIYSKMSGQNISENTIDKFYKIWEDYMIYNDEVSYIYLGNNKGEIYVRPKYTVDKDFIVQNRPWYKGALKNENKNNWLIYKDYKSRTHQLSISKKIYLSDNNIGVLSMDISIAQISAFLSEIVKDSQNETLFLVNDQILISEKLDDSRINQNILFKIRNKPKNKTPGFFKEGKWYVFYSPLFIDGWNLVKVVDISEIESELNSYIQLSKTFFLLQVITIIFCFLYILYKFRYSYARDPLTGLKNRELLKKILLKSDRKNIEYSIFFLDIDNFKKINDTYGHQTGDIVLKRIASLLEKLTGKKNEVYRYGGEEFLIYSLLNKDEVLQLGENIRKQVEDLKWREGFKVTISLGIKVAKNDKSYKVLKRADELLYLSKSEGKNKISFEM